MEISITNIVTGLMLVGLRVSGLVMFAPFLGSNSIPVRIKAILVMAITALLYPVYAPNLPAVTVTNWVVLVITELVVGIALGFATNMAFEAAQMAGQVLSIQMGYSLVNILDPNTKVETTVVSMFHTTIVMLIFLRFDVHLWIVRAVAKSFAYLPPGSVHLTGTFTMALLHGMASVMSVGVQIAAPVIAATLVTDVVLGMLGKASPQMPLMLLGPAVKSIVGLLVLGTALRYWPSLFERYFKESIAFGEHVLHLAS
jgi:flagellar biosynthesis protein FliR